MTKFQYHKENVGELILKSKSKRLNNLDNCSNYGYNDKDGA